MRALLRAFPLFLLIDLPGGLAAAQIKTETAGAFDTYMKTVEARMVPRFRGEKFLWTDQIPGRDKELQQGAILIQPAQGKGSIDVKGGLIHDWVGAVFVPGATLANALKIVQDYPRHSEYYKPEVAAAKIVSREDGNFLVAMRIVRSKYLISAVLNTVYDIRFVHLDANRVYSTSYSKKVAEISDAGKPGEHELPVGNDRGLVWRIEGFWFFEERDGGVYIECESIGLTRDAPFGSGGVLGPILRSVPAESLRTSLDQTRKAILSSLNHLEK